MSIKTATHKVLPGPGRNRSPQMLRMFWHLLLAFSVLFAHGFGQIHGTVHAGGEHLHRQVLTNISFAASAQQQQSSLLTELVDALCASSISCASLEHQLGTHAPVSNPLALVVELPPSFVFSLLPMSVSGNTPASLRARGPPAFKMLMT